jgi:hypothetical protein
MPNKDKVKAKEYSRKYYLEHKEDAKAYQKKYRLEHKEYQKEYMREYNLENKEHIRKLTEIWHLNHEKEIKDYRRKHYLEHKEEVKEHTRKYRREHPEKKREAERKYRREHPEVSRKYNLEHKEQRAINDWKARLKKFYGIDSEEYDSVFKKQGGVCAICGKPPNGKKLSVDHDHNTNKVRGLLCYSCNSGLGFFVDSRPNLQNALIYLIKSQLENES